MIFIRQSENKVVEHHFWYCISALSHNSQEVGGAHQQYILLCPYPQAIGCSGGQEMNPEFDPNFQYLRHQNSCQPQYC